MGRLKAAVRAAWTSAQVRKDVRDLAKVIVGVVAAHFGIKFA